MAKLRDKPPPPGYERHPLDPNLLRKIVPRTVAQAMYPNLPSVQRPPPPPKPMKQGREGR
jgi:hypothetical protein